MLKIFAAVCILGGTCGAFYAASMMTGSASRVSGPSWLYSHY